MGRSVELCKSRQHSFLEFCCEAAIARRYNAWGRGTLYSTEPSNYAGSGSRLGLAFSTGALAIFESCAAPEQGGLASAETPLY